MAIGNITKTAVDRLAQGWLWDGGHREAVKGFGARRQPGGGSGKAGGVFYYLRYRLGGRQRVISIGRHGAPWTPDAARVEAKRLLGIVASGVDPAAPAVRCDSFGVEIERYLTQIESTQRPHSHAENVRYLRQHAKPLHRLTLAEIDRRAIAECLSRVEAEIGAVTRNRFRSGLSAFYAWAIAEGLADENPVIGTRPADEGGSRTRVLTDAELVAVLQSLGDDHYGDMVRLLILTGQRREEIGGLRWSEIAEGGGAIVLPPTRTKNHREHILPLSRQAQGIIDRHRHRQGDPASRKRLARSNGRAIAREGFVFGEGISWSRRKAVLDARIGPRVAPWRLHDLRRTVATRLGDLGVLPHVVEAILNHVSGFRSGVAGVYNLTRYSAEMRDALQRWADHIDRLMSAAQDLAPSCAEGDVLSSPVPLLRPRSVRLVRRAGVANA